VGRPTPRTSSPRAARKGSACGSKEPDTLCRLWGKRTKKRPWGTNLTRENRKHTVERPATTKACFPLDAEKKRGHFEPNLIYGAFNRGESDSILSDLAFWGGTSPEGAAGKNEGELTDEGIEKGTAAPGSSNAGCARGRREPHKGGEKDIKTSSAKTGRRGVA